MAAGMAIAPTNKRTIRQQTNPLDKATIVSICPLRIADHKHTTQPSYYVLEPGSEENPSILVVGPSSWWREIDEHMPLIELTSGAMVVADAVIKDYCNGMLEITEDAYPGFFFVPGAFDIEYIKKNYSTAFTEVARKQKNWFRNLVDLGDKGWANTNGNPRAINGLMRMAAEALGMQDRDWMKTTLDIKKIPCVACGNLRNPAYPICGACNRVVDLKLAQKLGIVDLTK